MHPDIIWTASEQVNELGARLYIQRRPPENVIAAAYLQFAHEGLLETIWHGNSVPPLSKILESSKRDDTAYYSFFRQDLESEKFDLCGLGWVTDLVDLGCLRARGTVGMAFFKSAQNRRLTKAFCEMALDDGFQKLGLEAAYGFAPVANRAACLFHRAMSFEVLCVAPSYSTWQGKPCDVQISCLTKERWEQQSRSGQAQSELVEA